jgi:hypothetical protein
VARLSISLLIIALFCTFGFDSFAQSSVTLGDPDQPIAASPTAPAKKSPRKKASIDRSTPQPSSEEAEKAARLAEGRKKFFDQSSGFENNGSDNPVSLSGGNPSVGFKF